MLALLHDMRDFRERQTWREVADFFRTSGYLAIGYAAGTGAAVAEFIIHR